MTKKGQPVSKTTNGDWCLPNGGYGLDAHNAVDIELDKYDVIATVGDSLPASDEQWPKGAVIEGTYKVGNKILRKKVSLADK